MYSAVLIIPDEDPRQVNVYSLDAVAVVLDDAYIDCLTSHDGLIDFWFRPSPPVCYRANPRATEFLLVNSAFTAATVPLLYGGVVVCSRTADGYILGLTATDHRRLHSPSWPSRHRLRRRFAQARRRAHRTIATSPIRRDSHG